MRCRLQYEQLAQSLASAFSTASGPRRLSALEFPAQSERSSVISFTISLFPSVFFFLPESKKGLIESVFSVKQQTASSLIVQSKSNVLLLYSHVHPLPASYGVFAKSLLFPGLNECRVGTLVLLWYVAVSRSPVYSLCGGFCVLPVSASASSQSSHLPGTRRQTGCIGCFLGPCCHPATHFYKN